jgi:hypothetical protein
MIPYQDFQPTGMDPKGLGLPEKQNWLVVGIATNRDADTLTQSNWEVLCRELEKAEAGKSGESDWDIHRFGHWGPGWFQLVLVRPETPVAKVAKELEDCLSEYPVLDDNHYSDLESQEIEYRWKQSSLRERVTMCQKAGVNIMAARHDDCPSDCFSYLRDQ